MDFRKISGLPYGRQYITQEDIDAVVEVLKSDFLTQGRKVNEFEESFANYVGSKYAVAVSNGTAALHLSALALGVNKGTNVITVPLTFAASANAILYSGGNVFFCDINPQTWTIDFDKLEALIQSYPKGFFKGIIPVDFAGFPVNMEAIYKIAQEHNL